MPIDPNPRTFIHLLPAEREIWARFLPRIIPEAIKADYDVHLGKGIPLPPDIPENIRRQALATTRKRVDAVVWFPEAIIIYEIKPRCGMSALGQLLNYRRLYLEEYSPALAVGMAVVCERIEPDILESFHQQEIEVYVV